VSPTFVVRALWTSRRRRNWCRRGCSCPSGCILPIACSRSKACSSTNSTRPKRQAIRRRLATERKHSAPTGAANSSTTTPEELYVSADMMRPVGHAAQAPAYRSPKDLLGQSDQPSLDARVVFHHRRGGAVRHGERQAGGKQPAPTESARQQAHSQPAVRRPTAIGADCVSVSAETGHSCPPRPRDNTMEGSTHGLGSHPLLANCAHSDVGAACKVAANDPAGAAVRA
jgi:hypothetical protein